MKKDLPFALIAMNAFKGTLTNRDACQAVAEAFTKAQIPNQILPIGDGGRGTLWTVQGAFGGDIVSRTAVDPFGGTLEAKILCFPHAERPKWIYVESAEVVGHHLVPEAKRDALRASSQGLGSLLAQIAAEWGNHLERLYLGLGDSAISDAGMGMLSALGYTFTDQAGRTLWGNADGLRFIHSFKSPVSSFLPNTKITVLCDVINPLCGPNGAAAVFSPQKGATPEQVRLISLGMENFATILQKTTGWKVAAEPMTGSAGGLATALLVFLRAELVHGARFLLDWIEFNELIKRADIVITGEGRTDRQTLQGKAPAEILTRAQSHGKRSLLISGKLEEGFQMLLKKHPDLECFACGDKPSASEALKGKALEIAENLVALLGPNRAPTPR